MNSENNLNKILNILIQQKEIFGDELFIPKNEFAPVSKKNFYESKAKLDIVSENPVEYQLFSDDDWIDSKNLDELFHKIKDCKKCELHKYRTNFVFGSGNPNADVMVIGEGPGAEEDLQGLPFVGRAGMLLTDILKAIKFSRDEVYIANIVKCRPPNNRVPLQDEMDACINYLKKQIELIKPKLILCLGLTAAKGLLGKKDSLNSLRGKVFNYNSIKVMVTFHPAALLRNPSWKRDCWKDVQEFRKLYDELINNQSN
ncbi:MAG: uracil-DNA glycosylase [Ignavibacterium sp.]|nr:uracil-DNA glycosylase [Ignavibacterium sp.]MDW8374723.1 uracil-DNA glycosylase [Ignavibacteriales bacterium]